MSVKRSRLSHGFYRTNATLKFEDGYTTLLLGVFITETVCCEYILISLTIGGNGSISVKTTSRAESHFGHTQSGVVKSVTLKSV